MMGSVSIHLQQLLGRWFYQYRPYHKELIILKNWEREVGIKVVCDFCGHTKKLPAVSSHYAHQKNESWSFGAVLDHGIDHAAGYASAAIYGVMELKKILLLRK